MRRLLVNGAFWGAYGQLAIITGPVFTGLALWMGLRASDIALVASIAAFAGLAQPFSFLIAAKMRNQKRFIIVLGLLEITLMCCVVLVPFFLGTGRLRFTLAALAALGGTLCGNLVAPLFNSWFSTILPEESRARMMGKRLILVNIAAMAVGYAAGQIIDFTGGSHWGFAVPYVMAWLVGAGGYFVLLRIPFPSILKVEGDISLNRALILPLKHRQFRNLLIFYLTLVLAALIADPFYNVFMIRDLGISYATIGILNVVVLSIGVMGYRLWGSVAARFGSKPVLGLLMIPRMILPLLWFILSPANYHLYIYLIMIANGLVFSGLNVAINTLLFGSIPESGDKAAYFAVWAVTSSLVNALSTAVGGMISRSLADFHFAIGRLDIGNIKVTFLLSGILMIVPAILWRRVHDTDAKPVIALIGQMLRGNPVAYAYNAFLFSRTRASSVRARAVRAMGRSGSPMAVDRLARAMADSDPVVREHAVLGLGDSKSAEAVDHLTRALTDEESELRAEAAASLGRLRHPSAVDALLRAVDSPDIRVAISAARALGDIGGEAARERLFGRISSGKAPKSLLPTLIESSSLLGDLRVVRPAMEAVRLFESPVVRLQLLNAVCRGMGGRTVFYTLLSLDDYDLADRLDQMLQTMIRRFKHAPGERTHEILEGFARIRNTIEEGRYVDTLRAALTTADSMELGEEIAVEARDALRYYADSLSPRQTDRPEIFSVVCLGIIVDSMP